MKKKINRTCSVEPFNAGTLGGGLCAGGETSYTFGEAVT